MGAYVRRDARGVAADLERVLAHFPILAERRRQAAGTLSGGEQQMLAIGRALMARPRLILFDEPSLGLAPDAGGDDLRDHRRHPERRHDGADGRAERVPRAPHGRPRAYVMETGPHRARGPAPRPARERPRPPRVPRRLTDGSQVLRRVGGAEGGPAPIAWRGAVRGRHQAARAAPRGLPPEPPRPRADPGDPRRGGGRPAGVVRVFTFDDLARWHEAAPALRGDPARTRRACHVAHEAGPPARPLPRRRPPRGRDRRHGRGGEPRARRGRRRPRSRWTTSRSRSSSTCWRVRGRSAR